MNGISLIVPFHSRTDYFGEMLDSLKNLTVKPAEIILVNNNAHAQAIDIATQFRVEMMEQCQVVIVDCEAQGVCAARNAGLKQATGDYVYFFDSDDLMSADFLERAMAEINRWQLDMYVYVTQIVDADNHVRVRNYGASLSPAYQVLSSFLTTQSMVIRRQFLFEAGGWDESIAYWNDWELGIRLLAHHPTMKYIPQPPCHVLRAHSNTITGSGLSQRLEAIDFVLNKVAGQHDDPSIRKALYLRRAIIAGKVKAEGSDEGAKQLRQPLCQAKESMCTKILALLLYHYTALGLPGAWRIAVRFLCQLKSFTGQHKY